MKKKSVYILTLLLTIIMILSLTACGTPTPPAASESASVKPAESSVAAESSAAVESSEAATPEPAKPVDILLWTKPNADATAGQIAQHDAMMVKVHAKFPNINITEESLKPGVDYRQEYDKALMAGIAPTGCWLFPYVDIQTRVKNGTIAEITDLVNNWDLKKSGVVWTAFDLAISTPDGKWYAVPSDCYAMGTLVNLKALKEGGGDPENLPKTWAEFSEVGKKVTDLTVPRFGYELLGMDWNAWPFTAWVWSSGGEMVRDNNDGTFTIGFNEPAGVDAAMYWNQMVWQDKMTQKDVLQDWNKVTTDIKSGLCVFAWAGVDTFSQDDLAKIGATLEDFSVIPMPVKDASIPNPSFSGGQVITINPKATKEEAQAAFDVLTYMRYDEDALIEQWQLADQFQIADITPCVNTSLTEKKYSILTAIPENLKKALLDNTKNAKPEPYCSNWNDLKNALVKPLQQIILKKDLTREECQKILDQCADELYAKYPGSFVKK